jgi:glycosyltransferase involved in cell wall biosynthesis
MDVSVIIPTCDRPALLRQAIESVLLQTMRPREVIVVDNGSGDATRAMLESTYGSAVICIAEPQRGVQAARNAGIACAGGSWIATLDDDDLWCPDFLEQMALAASDGRANLIYSDHRKFAETDNVRAPSSRTNFETAPVGFWDGVPRPGAGDGWSFVGKFPAKRLLRFNPFYPSSMAARKELIEAIGGFDTGVRGIKAEDMEFLTRALIAGELAIVWQPLVEYRIHGSNSCGGDWLSQMIGRWRIFEYVYARGAYGCADLHEALHSDLPGRRTQTFDQAWRFSQFAVTDELQPLLRDEDWTMLRRLRVAVRAAPAPVRSAVMHFRSVLAHTRGVG